MPNVQTKTLRDINDKLGDNGGCFDLVVKPMLQQGHEGELCSWLKEVSLIRTVISCTNVDCNGRNLTWSPARIIDKYNWICSDCSSKKSIRENSFFFGIKCDLKLCLQIILGWCQMIPKDTIAEYLGLKEHIIKKVYEKCAKVSEAYIKKHTEEWCLGGPGMVVIVDEFPGGYMSQSILDVTVNKKRNNNSHTILCIAEANSIPPRMWFHMLSSHPETPKSDKKDIRKSTSGIVEEAIKEIVQHVLPESYIVTNNRARCCNYEALQSLKQYNVFSVEHLRKHDQPGKTELLHNLETIWQTAIAVCEDVQEATLSASQQILSTYLWRQRFGSSPSLAFQYMLNHIAECYKFT